MQKIRKIKQNDIPIIKDFLKKEGLQDKDIQIEKNTFVLDDQGIKGFISVRFQWGCIYLTHFLVSKSYRNASRAIHLARFFKYLIKKLGYSNGMVSICKNDKRIKKVVELFFKAKPYSEADNHIYYQFSV